MDRRQFMRRATNAVTTGVLANSVVSSELALGEQRRHSKAARPLQALMKVGTQQDSSDGTLLMLAAFGVRHICGSLPSPRLDERWSVESLVKLRERIESFGIRLEMLPLPLSSGYITEAENPHIMLGQSPERDREIEDICQMIRNAARAGVPRLKYNLSILGVVRTEPIAGRGGAIYSSFAYDRAKQEPPLTDAGPVSEDQYWERITYFLKRVIPVAEEYKVRMACHPHDPGMPRDKGFRGVHTVLGNVEGLKRFIDLIPSKYHGLNFCQGSISEMLPKPGQQIFDVIRYFGGRGKIFNVHFRNISGGYLDFRETFIDDGDVDMLKAMKVYREVGYDGMIMPDHVPEIAGDTQGQQAFAYTFGYIKALIAAVNSETERPVVQERKDQRR
jgi:mannonate dehydratase